MTLAEVAVIVPARDEQHCIAGCIDGVRGSIRRLQAIRPDVRARIVLVLDECTDDTLAVVPAGPDLDVLGVRARSAGGARAVGAAHVLESLTGAANLVWLANTDADSCVPADWLVEMVADAERGAHLVLGTVEPDAFLDGRAETLWRRRHQLIEDHPHVHGANFGIRADTYRQLGGWATIATGEDVDLAERAARDPELVVRRTARIPVVTSSRAQGRAPAGFASYLSDLVAELADDLAQPA
jgi:hypothetical protein